MLGSIIESFESSAASLSQLQQSLNVLILAAFALQRVKDIPNLPTLKTASDPERASVRAPYKAMASGLLELYLPHPQTSTG
jgi:hypothetical protein